MRIVPILGSVALTACSPNIVGTWQSDDGKSYAEVHFAADHSFVMLSRPSLRRDDLSIMSDLGREFGTWQMRGRKIQIDAVDPSLKEPLKAIVAVSMEGDRLKLQNPFEPSNTDTYQRLPAPRCSPALVTAQDVSESDIVGRWRCHYHTHVCEFVFRADHRGSIHVRDEIDADVTPMDFENWQLTGQTLAATRKTELGDPSPRHITWKIVRKGSDCLTVDDGWPIQWTLERIPD